MMIIIVMIGHAVLIVLGIIRNILEIMTRRAEESVFLFG